MKKMSAMGWIVWVLVVIGALAWGVLGFFQYNIVVAIFGSINGAVRIIYALVGLAGLWMLVSAFMSSEKE